MEKRFLIILLFFLTFAGQSYAGQWRTYTVADGLIGPEVTAIFQDSLGNLWFGTRNGGVSLYDGESFRSFSRQHGLTGGSVGQILEDRRGHLWFVMERKPESRMPEPIQSGSLIFRYDGKTFHRIESRDGLAGGASDAVVRDRDGNIWVANKYGLMKHDGKRFHRFGDNKFHQFVLAQGGPDGRIYSIYESRNGSLWIGGGPRMGFRRPGEPGSREFPFVIQYDGNDFRFFSLESFIIPQPPGDFPPRPQQSASINAISEDSAGNIWLGGENLLLRYNGRSFERFDGMRQSKPENIKARGVDPGEVILTWEEPLGSTGETLFSVTTYARRRLFRPTENEWVTRDQNQKSGNFQYRHRIAGISVYSILKDNKGNLWFNNRDFVSLWNGKELQHFVIPSNWEEIKKMSKGKIPPFYPGNISFEDAQGGLWFKGANGVYKFDGKEFQSFTVDDGLGSDDVSVIFEAMDGKLWFGHNNGVTLFDPSPPIIQNFTTRETLGSSSVHHIYEDRYGRVWFSIRGGVAKYDGEKMEYLPIKDNGSNNPPYPFANPAMTALDGKDGDLWFIGNDTNQIFRYSDGRFQHYRVWADRVRPINRKNFREGDRVLAIDTEGRLLFAEEESLIRCDRNGCQLLTERGFQAISNTIPVRRDGPGFGMRDFRRRITEIFVDSQGSVWYAISNVGVKRYNVNIRVFTASDGLEGGDIRSIFEDRQRNIWFIGERYITRYDGRSWQKFPVSNATDLIAIHQDSHENILFVYSNAIAKYDKGTIQLSHQDDVSSENIVRSSIIDSGGNLWLATSDGAIKYDGRQFTTYTTENGLLVNDIRDVCEDKRGNLWLATWGGGIALYNGENFQIITTKDGLVHNNVRRILEDTHGNLWFATDGGITKYTPSLNILPRVKLTKIIAKAAYTDFGKELQLSSGSNHLVFEYQGFSFQPGNTVYAHKLEGFDTGWSQPSEDKMVEYTKLGPGSYTFMVKAFYKNSSYSNPPSAVRLTIAPYYWTQPIVYIPICVGIVVVVAFIYLATKLITQRRHSAVLRAELRQKEEAETQRVKSELSEARNMQMSLLPKSAPDIHKFELAGVSMPANEVGGDFYDYLAIEDNLIGIALVDVSGKGLRGAMNAVMAYGMLHEVAKAESKADTILARLNIDLHPMLQDSMFAALNLGILNPQTKQVQYSNAGQSYPIIKRDGKVEGVELGGFPLGIIYDAAYDEKIIDLYEGDYLIFYTDGLTDAMNEAEQVYGFDRLNDTIRKAPATLSAEEMVQHVLQDVNAFVGESKQYDDMTLIILRCMDN